MKLIAQISGVTLICLLVITNAIGQILKPGVDHQSCLYDATVSATVQDPIDFNTVFMVGSASPNGWNIENSTELVKNPENPWEFSYTGTLKVGEFKFPVNRNKYWGQDFFMKSTDVLMFLGKTPDSKWNITEQTGYQVKMNIKTLNISIKKLNVAVTGLIPTGQSNCYNAVQTLTVAGNGTSFTVSGGGNATLIAGQKIVFLPGTTVFLNGYLHGYISEISCGQKSAMIPVFASEGGNGPEILSEISFRLFPNPTSGSFTIELSSEQAKIPASAECYNSIGELIFQKNIESGMRNEFSLSGQSSGIYFFRMNQDGKTGQKKIIKQ